MKLEVLNINGEKTGKEVELPENIFGIEPNEHSVYLTVKQYLANQRQGTHKSKERGEITGSRRKLHRQKGTGGSRKGDIKSPLFRGGGRIFGPRPRTYTIRLNKKVKTLARKSALSSKMQENQILVVEDFTFDQPKTKEFVSILSNLNAADTKSLLVLSEIDKTLNLSSRNLKKAKITVAKDLNVYDVLDSNYLILSESSIEKLIEVFA